MNHRTLPLIIALVCFSYAGVGDAVSASFLRKPIINYSSSRQDSQQVVCTRSQQEKCYLDAVKTCGGDQTDCWKREKFKCVLRCGGPFD